MRAKQQARLIRDVRNSKLVSATLISDRDSSGNYSKRDINVKTYASFSPR